MKVFDFNIHLPYLLNKEVNEVIAQDITLDSIGIQKGFNTHKHVLDDCIGANILLFNTKLFELDISPLLKIKEYKEKIIKFTALIDFRRRDIKNYIDNLVKCGVNAVMVNSYLQKINDTDFSNVLIAFKYAQRKGLIICIDGSYGTSKMYTYDNLKLACFISDHIHSSPIVIVHAGGYRLIEAMLLASDKNNVWLDTSFSLPYYENSSIETDFAYVLRKMNCERIVFGSDHPYLPFKDALDTHLNFFKKHDFKKEDLEKILYRNSLELFNV
jgi:predicted TIM-barrel fold metal-dependent hydrolase